MLKPWREGLCHPLPYFNRLTHRYHRCRLRLRPFSLGDTTGRGRSGLTLLLVVGLAFAAQAQDARLTFLAKQLSTAKDPRVRAQTAVILGSSGQPGAIDPLCKATRDADVLVRVAAANALGELGLDDARDCLREIKDSSPQVQAAIAAALRPGKVTSGGLYVYLEPVTDKAGGLSDATLATAEKLLREKLGTIAGFAPAAETKPQAVATIRSKRLRGFRIRPQLSAVGAKGLKIELLVMTYPEQAIKGAFNVKASGAEHGALLKVMVPRVVDDAAEDLEWKSQ